VVGVGQGALVWAHPAAAASSAAASQRVPAGSGDAQKPAGGRNLAVVDGTSGVASIEAR
jgi:hypothetical protein